MPIGPECMRNSSPNVRRVTNQTDMAGQIAHRVSGRSRLGVSRQGVSRLRVCHGWVLSVPQTVSGGQKAPSAVLSSARSFSRPSVSAP